uniref:Uncharacterized protein n=1 Tax=Anopheles christyi TaxID=43041 RepID=A0A182KIU2_9DIPT
MMTGGGTTTVGTAASTAARVFLLLDALLKVHLGVALLLVRAGKLAATDVTGERFLAGVCADVRRQVVGAAEGAHADPTLERFLSRVNPDMSGQLVRARESPVTVFYRAGVRALVNGRLAWPVRVLPWLHRYQLQGHRALLVDLRQYLVSLAGGLIILGQLDGILGLLGGLCRRQATELARIGRAGVRCGIWFLFRNDGSHRDGRGRGSGQYDRTVLWAADVRVDRRIQPLVLLAHLLAQPLTLPAIPVHILTLLLLLHIERPDAAVVARRLLQDDVRTVHV